MSNQYLDLSDEVLAIQSKSDNEAMEYLIKKYNNLVLARARAYFLIGADKDDLIQEGMIGLYKAIRDFDINKVPNFSAFADLCVKRQLITAIKTATRLKHTPLNSYISFTKNSDDDDDQSLLDILYSDVTHNPENMIVSKEYIEELQNSLNTSLSKMEKKVLNYYLKGLDYTEIAVVMEKPVKSIDNALQRIKKKISNILYENGKSML
jgi:RNA polymerase sporulation-specific sigma factor